jgi:hypothetical protein
MNADIADRLVMLERRQRRASRWLILLGIVVFLQAATIACLAVPFGGPVKHLITLSAGRFEVIDQNGTVRAVLTADTAQTMLSMSDAKGTTRILLRENDTGFATMEFFDRASNEKTMTLFTGTKRSFLELRDPKTRRYLNIQAAEQGMGLMQFDERDQMLP